MGEATVFWICAVLATVGGLGLIVSRKAVHSALWVALTMISLAVIYLSLNAPFLGMVQVVVYTGAVMMLFLFVLMIVGIDASDSLAETIKGQRGWGIVFAVAMGALLVLGIGSSLTGVPSAGLDKANDEFGGNVQGLARLIFSDYLVPFEVTSALLITAALGAMVLAHRELWTEKLSQMELSQLRFRSVGHPGNKPNPGIYARHNAVDTPGLLPDGSTSEESIPEPLRARHQERPVDNDDVNEVKAITSGEATTYGEGH